MTGQNEPTLRILHVLRAPVGGLFRHVCDLTREQIARGHQVGLITDALTGGDKALAVLAALEPQLGLGMLRMPIHRLPHPNELLNAARIHRRIMDVKPDVVHGHGAKGGLYARLAKPFAPPARFVRAYTPHGGSLHYRKGRWGASLFLGAEALLVKTTDLFLFESTYIANLFNDAFGLPDHKIRVVLNGVSAAEFEPVIPDVDAADFVCLGELRTVKGIEMVIDALNTLRSRTGVTHTVSIVGTGPEERSLRQHADALGLGHAVTFHGLLPVRKGLARGRTLVMPSRLESLPYVLLEAVAAQTPIIATNVGGIPEIFGDFAPELVEPEELAITDAMQRALNEDPAVRAKRALALATFVRERFSITQMAESAIAGYRDALSRKRSAASSHPAHVGSPS